LLMGHACVPLFASGLESDFFLVSSACFGGASWSRPSLHLYDCLRWLLLASGQPYSYLHSQPLFQTPTLVQRVPSHFPGVLLPRWRWRCRLLSDLFPASFNHLQLDSPRFNLSTRSLCQISIRSLSQCILCSLNPINLSNRYRKYLSSSERRNRLPVCGRNADICFRPNVIAVRRSNTGQIPAPCLII
jgi:hypothetical protein